MGESVAEATVTAWLKEVGDTIEMDEAVMEIATDKVDSEVPSEVEGVLAEKCFEVNDVVQVGQTLAIIEMAGKEFVDSAVDSLTEVPKSVEEAVETAEEMMTLAKEAVVISVPVSERFYSPLVKNIARQEGIALHELDTLEGSGKGGRVTKKDILSYVGRRAGGEPPRQTKPAAPAAQPTQHKSVMPATSSLMEVGGKDEIIEMTRMGKLISQHMRHSMDTAAHVQSFIEVDVTNLWNWRNKIKDDFYDREGEKLTFTPIFMEAVSKALKDYPMVNIQVQGDTVIKKKDINLGMATALADGNLIVPVIKSADRLNLVGMAKAVNDLAERARKNQLEPDEIQGGTYTVTNVGTFGSVMGTPIINQPQVGILALGAIRKMPAVIETREGDFIGIRMKMFLSHSYDHRVVNGALGGMFVKRVAEYLEGWDVQREI